MGRFQAFFLIFPCRAAVISANIERAISSGVRPPRSKPIGAFNRSRAPLFKPSLRKRRITARTKIVLDPEHTVTFGPSGRSKRHPIPTRPPQFAHIDDAEKVFHLMQQIQKETS